MVIVEENYLNLRSEYCQMHDLMRDVCLSKAKEDNFLQIVKVPTSTSAINAQSPRKSRRLVVHSGNLHHILRHKNNKTVRSLLVFGQIQSTSGLQSLPMLRMLDLYKVNFEGGKLPSSIGELIHLRFLSLYEAGISHLPSSLGNLKLLLYLNLDVIFEGESVHVPNVLKEMLELRYLCLPKSLDDKTELELGGLVNMEALGYFSMQQSSVTDLLRMTKLRILVVKLTGSCTFETLSSSLRELRNLETLSLLISHSMADSVGKLVLDLIHLKDLRIQMCMPRFPDQFRFPPHLAHIGLSFCRMEEDPMPILEKLLYLKSVGLAANAFIGRRMVCSKGGFPQLYALDIFKQYELEEWIVEKGSMSCLRTLTIRNCKKLKEIPDGLKYITFLKELKIEGMKREWKEKLVPGGEDYYKVQHILNVQFINCDDD